MSYESMTRISPAVAAMIALYLGAVFGVLCIIAERLGRLIRLSAMQVNLQVKTTNVMPDGTEPR